MFGKFNDKENCDNEKITPPNEVLDPGGVWKHIQIKSSGRAAAGNDNGNEEHVMDDPVSVNIFYYIGIPYLIAFMIISYFVWRFEQHQRQQILITSTTTSASWSGQRMCPAPRLPCCSSTCFWQWFASRSE